MVPVTVPQAVAGVLGLTLLGFVGWAVTVHDPLGGEPVVVEALPARSAARPEAGPAVAAAVKMAPRGPQSRYDGPSAAADPAAPPGGGKTITIIDGTSGKRQDVVVPGPPEQRSSAAGIDGTLLEGTRHGRIPKISASGGRSAEAYASASGVAQGDIAGASIAIVVGGLGISASTTADALSRLPPEVTLAFVPYGANLGELAARARKRGHEVLLQAPMEPFDYPDNDPGPQTLLTTLPSEQNIDRLHWLMSRFQGYVGVMNLMGGRFATSEKALTPVLSDIAKRGLLFVDDGASARSLASHLAAANNMPFVKAALVLDAVPTPAEIDRALTQLETIARKDGIAVATARAFPVSIDRIIRWAKGAKARGVTLVPVTVAALKQRSS